VDIAQLVVHKAVEFILCLCSSSQITSDVLLDFFGLFLWHDYASTVHAIIVCPYLWCGYSIWVCIVILK